MSFHHHHHHHHDHTALSSSNKDHFDKQAHDYAHSHSHNKVASYVASAIIDALSSALSEDTTRVLDYACGPGLISRALLPHVASVTGIDLSPNMVNEFNTAAQNQGLSKEEMQAVVGDLCSDQELLPEAKDFDVAVCSLALHHIADAGLTVKRIAERLKSETGMLAIVEFKPHGKMEHFEHVVAHHGFSEQRVRDLFAEAGLVDVRFLEVGPPGGGGKGVTFLSKDDEGKEIKIEREVFLAIGRKAA
ncbi:S-adenosyl-L-methionine-dependent methyltransferase [Ascodesmis nigricans]|uniref:S-adenosyl-L-methionine-dependent methyltransferase n=1 Tax=Ascodesmis nigricans TaxID=341454 RepID=A0A4S2N8S4_9PEZI|nr:S-adenosyl-L-methionine-dependent methyltransferase [Ascodesmis nigricans]